MILLDGKAEAAKIRNELHIEVLSGSGVKKRQPGLAMICVGDNPASAVYLRNKEKACAEVGIASFAFRLPVKTTQAEVLHLIHDLNLRQDVDGILLQLPLPANIDPVPCLLAIDPGKDVDGFHPDNVGRLALGLPGFKACTPAGVMELLKRYGLSPTGQKAVIVGRSDIVGKPLALLLAQPVEFANATVTICHSATANLAKECVRADFLFLAIGRPRMIKADFVREGAVVVDIGINRTPEGLCGDVDFTTVAPKVRAITPVPGGIGPMTVSMLLKNTVQAWHNHLG